MYERHIMLGRCNFQQNTYYVEGIMNRASSRTEQKSTECVIINRAMLHSYMKKCDSKEATTAGEEWRERG